uniref:Uncharacterized protein n=1 Tax=Avena sativa TaxID=4498 RepID=A0ACD5UTJ6_AVESA
MASSPVLLGAAGAAVLTGTPAGNAVPRPCFLAARPRALSGGRLCLQTPPRATPEYNKAADATEDAIEGAKGVAAELKKGVAEAAAAVSGDTEKAVEATEEKTSEAAAEAKDLGKQVKQATEEAWDSATDAAKGVTDKIAAEAKAAAKE